MKMLTLLLALVSGINLLAVEPIRIVAAENFYGGVAAQIAGSDAEVISILSNPNQDPHEFSSSAGTAKAVADADIVIYNGLGYDTWMEKLLGTDGRKGRVVIRVADLTGAKDGANPHLWYNPRTMPALAQKLGDEIIRRVSLKRDEMAMNVANFQQSIRPVLAKITEIKTTHSAITVTATEPVFGYMAEALGFKMLNNDFQSAVMNETEPSAAQTAAFEKSLSTRQVKILFYNQQVADPTTERLKRLAVQSGVPIVGVTETQPANRETYVDWMLGELNSVQDALEPKTGFRDLNPHSEPF